MVNQSLNEGLKEHICIDPNIDPSVHPFNHVLILIHIHSLINTCIKNDGYIDAYLHVLTYGFMDKNVGR